MRELVRGELVGGVLLVAKRHLQLARVAQGVAKCNE